MDKNQLKQAFIDSLPAFFGYLPIGMVFGLLFLTLGLPWYLAPLMSLIVYAGAVQFVALSMIAAESSVIALFITAAMIAFRNSFYGIALFDRYNLSFWKKQYLIFGLVDAIYATVLNRPKQEEEKTYLLTLTALSHFYWIVGTLIGAYFANDSLLIPGLEFALTALFTVFFIEQWKKNKNIKLLVAGLFGFVLGLATFPDQAFFIGLMASFGYTYLQYRRSEIWVR